MPPGHPFRYDVLEKSCTRLLPFPAIADAADEDDSLKVARPATTSFRPSSHRRAPLLRPALHASMPPHLQHDMHSESPRSSSNPAVPPMKAKPQGSSFHVLLPAYQALLTKGQSCLFETSTNSPQQTLLYPTAYLPPVSFATDCSSPAQSDRLKEKDVPPPRPTPTPRLRQRSKPVRQLHNPKCSAFFLPG